MADDLSPEEQDAIGQAAAGGGGLQIGNKPTPGARRKRLVNGYVVVEVANKDREWDVDTTVAPIPFTTSTPTDKNQQVIHTDGGTLEYDRQADEWKLIPGTEPPTKWALHTLGNQVYWVNSETQEWKLAATDKVAEARQQSADQRAADQQSEQADLARQGNTRAWNADTRAGNAEVLQAQGLMNQVEQQRSANAIAQAQLEESALQNEFTRNYQVFGQLPYTQIQDQRAAEQARLQAAAGQGTYETARFNAARGAGQDAVSTSLATLPYRTNPEFTRQFVAYHNAEMAGQPLPAYTADALQFRAPDLEGQRQAATAQAYGQLPTYGSLVEGAPEFASMDPERAKQLQRLLLGLPYQPAVAS